MWSSSRLRPDGSIVGNDNDADADRYEPLHRTIGKASQVQIYEAIMQTREGRVTSRLLSAVRFVKDNRLLPEGFEKASAGPDITVRGEASTDADFTGGVDRISYRVPVPESRGPFRIEVRLWHQPIGPIIPTGSTRRRRTASFVSTIRWPGYPAQ